MKFFYLFFLNSIIVVFGASISPKITCRDESGQPIDWFTVYKLPKSSPNDLSKFISVGTAYSYITNTNQKWALSKNQINESSIVSQTLKSLYENTFTDDKSLGYVLYNDQSLENDLASRAHAKGIIIFDGVTALWIAHSIPKFPPKQSEKNFDVGDEQLKFGQSMICLSLPFSALSQVGLQLLYAYPQIYDSFIPKSMTSNPVLTNLVDVVAGKRINTLPGKNIENLKTLANNEFVTFYKNTKFGQDLYLNFIADSLKTNLFTETWSRGVGTKDSDCTLSYTVNNIKAVKFDEFKLTFPVTNDHSKWAINQPVDKNQNKYVCIGDINRQASQTKRGGGTICFLNNQQVWDQYFKIINEIEPCENEKTN